jgi:hypothetical protein
VPSLSLKMRKGGARRFVSVPRWAGLDSRASYEDGLLGCRSRTLKPPRGDTSYA